MPVSFFDHIEMVERFLTSEFDLETALIDKNLDYAKKYIEEVQVSEVLRPSQNMCRVLYRANISYLMGSYLTLLNGIPSYSYMGLRVVLESIVRGYYYLCDEVAACNSLLYMISLEDYEEGDEVVEGIFDTVKDEALDEFMRKMFSKRIHGVRFSADEKRLINDREESSRDFKKMVDAMYTKSRQRTLRNLWSMYSRYSHAGIRGRYRDLSFRPEYFSSCYRDLVAIMFLLCANIIMYIEAFYPYVDSSMNYFMSLVRYLEAYPSFAPNKRQYKSMFMLKNPEELMRNFINRQ